MNHRIESWILVGWFVVVATAFAIPPEEWAKQLESTQEADRDQAELQLINLGSSAVPVLINALKHEDEDVRGRAALALGKIGPNAEPAIPMLAKAINDPSLKVRASAAHALGRIPGAGPVAVPALIKCVDDSITAGMAKKRSREELLNAIFGPLTDRDREIALILRSIETLGSIGHESKIATSLLVKIVSNKNFDSSVRRAAEKSLAQIDADPEEAIPVLLAALSKNEEDIDVRGDAAEALAKFAAARENVLLALMDSASDMEVVVRYSSVSALGRIGVAAKTALPLLLKILTSDSSPAIRGQAVLAVSRVGFGDQETVLPALMTALETDNEVAATAASVFASWGEQGTPAVPSLVKALRAGDSRVHQSAAISLGKIGPKAKDAVPELMKQFTSRRVSIRPEAAYALWQIDGYEPGRQFLLDAMKTTDKEKSSERSRTAWLLGKMTPPPKEAVALLITALKDPNLLVRDNAASALRSIDVEAARKAGVPPKK